MPALVPLTPTARRWRTILLLFFALVYGTISLVNHYNFRTATLDLGLIAQAVGDFAHLRWPRTTLLLDAPPTPFLGQHFSLTPALAVPFYYLVGGSWALLLLQIIAILLGAYGVWRYAHAQGASPGEATCAMVVFASQWGVFSALSYDYHDNVVGAMAFPWLALWVSQRRGGRAVAAAIIILVSKENMALWLVFVLLGLAWQHRSSRTVVGWLGLGAGLAAGYFVVITQYVMPALDATHRPFTQIVRYAHLGPTLTAAVVNVLLHPALLWEALFHNTTSNPAFDNIKVELWVALLVSGGWALVWRPWYALMLVPILAQKMLSNEPAFWGINLHYSIELAPVLALAVTDTLLTRPSARTRRLAWSGALAGVAAFTLITLFVRNSKWYNYSNNNLLVAEHYRSVYPDGPGLRAALVKVPPDAPLSAPSSLVPHLLNRRDAFLFPVMRTARLVVLLREPTPESAWPVTTDQAKQAIVQFQADPNFQTLYEDAQLVVLSRQFAPADSAAIWQPQP